MRGIRVVARGFRLFLLRQCRILNLEQIVQFRDQEAQASFWQSAGNIREQWIVNLFLTRMKDDRNRLVFFA